MSTSSLAQELIDYVLFPSHEPPSTPPWMSNRSPSSSQSEFREKISQPSKVPVTAPIDEIQDSTIESVPVHTLCATCREFVKSCEELDTLQFKDLKLPKDFVGLVDVKYPLGPVQQVLQGLRKCHLCTLILTSWECFEGLVAGDLDPNEQVILELQPRKTPMRVTATYESAIEGGGGEFYIRASSDPSSVKEGYLLKQRSMPIHSRDNVPMIKHWLNTCISDHGGCRSFQSESTLGRRQFPTRILDVENGKTQLICDTTGCKESEYVSLSHMWGKPDSGHQLRLVESRLLELQKGIVEADLSIIYREAIRLTRLLGYRFIWIDSLCIIQDSKPDWKYESGRMALVYGNAILNISYLFPPDDTLIRERYDPRHWTPCLLRTGNAVPLGCGPDSNNDADRDAGLEGSKSVWIEHAEPPVSWLETKTWPLLNRAWVFQERFLCTRNVYIGHANLVWECQCAHLDELLGTVVHTVLPKVGRADEWLTKAALGFSLDRIPPPSDNLIMKNDNEDSEWYALSGWVRTWTRIVNEYRQKTLSYETDRVIAFAGFARMVSNLTRMLYIAGSWVETFQPFLLWSSSPCPPAEEDMAKAESQQTPTAPSWSWFSVPTTTRNRKLDWHANALLEINDTALSKAKNCYWARVVRIGCPGRDFEDDFDSLFYDFRNLQVVLDCMVLPARLVRSVDTEFELCIETLPYIETFLLRYFHDDPDVGMAIELPDRVIVVLVAEFRKFYKHWTSKDDVNTPVEHYLIGLTLVPSGEQNVWKRIGLWVLRKDVADLSSFYEGPLHEEFGSWRRKKICIV